MTGQLGYPIGFAAVAGSSLLIWWFAILRPLPAEERRVRLEKMRRRTLADPVFVSGVLLLGVVVPVVTLRHSRQEDNVLVWIARSGFPFVVMAALFISIDRVLSGIARSRGFDSAQDFLKSSDTSVSLKLGAASAYSVAVVATVVSVFVSIPGGM